MRTEPVAVREIFVAGQHPGASHRDHRKGEKNQEGDINEYSVTRQEKKITTRLFHHASGMGANSPGHPVPRLRSIKIPSEPFTGKPRSVRLCSCSHRGISAG